MPIWVLGKIQSITSLETPIKRGVQVYNLLIALLLPKEIVAFKIEIHIWAIPWKQNEIHILIVILNWKHLKYFHSVKYQTRSLIYSDNLTEEFTLLNLKSPLAWKSKNETNSIFYPDGTFGSRQKAAESLLSWSLVWPWQYWWGNFISYMNPWCLLGHLPNWEPYWGSEDEVRRVLISSIQLIFSPGYQIWFSSIDLMDKTMFFHALSLINLYLFS